jgi:low temperature requirement protein LtrA
MRSRSPDEAHRASTPLELLFDLVFVVAVAQASSHLHHGIAENHVAEAVLSYAMVFFAIWWAWMNFTWFASAYDTDDVPYRLAVFVQLAGALILAAGVPQAFDSHDFTVVTIGYVVMRLALVAQWLRAAKADPPRRTTALRFAIGVSALQIGWITLLFLPENLRSIGFPTLVLLEVLVPLWAERAAHTLWHPEHIAERYGLFTIIVLGETILSATVAVQAAAQAGELDATLLAIVVGGLLIVFSMWWLYFDQPAHHLLRSARAGFIWGYGHLLIFAAAAAVGAGIAVAVDQATHHAEIGALGAGLAVALPVAIFLVVLGGLYQRARARTRLETLLFVAAPVLVLLSAALNQTVLLVGLLLAALVAIKQVIRHQAGVA